MFEKSKKNPDSPTNQVERIVHPEDVQLARNAFYQHRDPLHALNHLAIVLEASPTHSEALLLLDTIIQATSNLVELLIPDDGENKSIEPQQASILAYIHFKRGEINQAFHLLHLIYESVEDFPYFPWLLDWLGMIASPPGDKDKGKGMAIKEPEQALTSPSLSPDLLQGLLFLLNKKLNQLPGNPEVAGAELLKLYPLVNSYQAQLVDKADKNKILLPLAVIIRTLGQVEKAIELAKTAYTDYPTYMGAVILANSYRYNSQEQEALALNREAHSLDPHNPSVLVDIAEILCELGDIEGGVASYSKALTLDPTHYWAYPAYLFFQSVLEPEGDWYAKLKEYVKANPHNPHARRFWRRCGLYLSELPEPGEAILNLAEKTLAESISLQNMTIASSSVEAPSSYRAVQLLQEELYGQATTRLKVIEIQKPDPRQPLRKVDFVLYRYNEGEPQPALPRPVLTSKLQELMEAVSEIAATPYEAEVWWIKAGKVAQTLDVLDANQIGALLALLLYPPARKAKFTIWVWLYRVQIAISFIIARLDENDLWENSIRRRILLTLAYGPMDWTVGAACLALCQILLRGEETGREREEIDKLYQTLLEKLSKPGFVPYKELLLYCAAYIGPSEKLAQLRQQAIADSE